MEITHRQCLLPFLSMACECLNIVLQKLRDAISELWKASIRRHWLSRDKSLYDLSFPFFSLQYFS